MDGGSYVGNLFKQKVVSPKNDLSATVTLHNNLFYHGLSDHIHCSNRPFTYVLRKDTLTLSRIKTYTVYKKCSQRIITQKQPEPCCLTEICEGSFTIVTPIQTLALRQASEESACFLLSYFCDD